MRILSIYSEGFGKLKEVEISFSDGTNVLYGSNEAGKTTLHTLIRAMFFGLEKPKGVTEGSLWEKYRPWHSEKYAARMKVAYEGKTYLVRRDFLNSPMEADITEIASGEKKDESILSDMLMGLSPQSYDNTISIGQLYSAADSGAADELKKYLINMNLTGNNRLNSEKAKEILKEKRRKLSERIVPEAARFYAAGLSEIKKIEAEINSDEYVSHVYELMDRLNDNARKLIYNEENSRILTTEIQNNAEVLSSNHFASEKELTEYGTKLFRAKEKYQKLEDTKLFKAVGIAAIIFAILAVGSFVLAYFKEVLPRNIFIIFAAFALLCAILVIVFENTLNSRKQMLDDILKEQVTEINDGSLERICEKIEELRALVEINREKQKNLEVLIEEKTELSSEKEKLQAELKEQKAKQSDYTSKLTVLNGLRDKVKRLKDNVEENGRINDEIDAIDLATETMDEISNDMKDTFAVFLNQDASKYIRGITGNTYDSMSIGEDLGVYMNTADGMVSIDKLSSGTTDQIYLAIRVALANRIAEGKSEYLPLIFDDSFVNYDEDRLNHALKWLTDTYEGQGLIFTCHMREWKMLDEAGADYQKIYLNTL